MLQRFFSAFASYFYNAIVSHKSSVSAFAPAGVAALAQFIQIAPQHSWAVRILQGLMAVAAAYKIGQRDPNAPALTGGFDTTIRPHDGRTGRTLSSITFAGLLLTAGLMVGCDKEKEIYKNVGRTFDLIEEGRTVRDELFAAKIISAQTGLTITRDLDKVHQATSIFRQRALGYRAQGGLTVAGKADLIALSGEVSTAINQLVQGGVLGIQDEKTRTKVLSITGQLQQTFARVVTLVQALKTTAAPGPVITYTSDLPPVQHSGGDFGVLGIILINAVLNFLGKESRRRGMTLDELIADVNAQDVLLGNALADDTKRYEALAAAEAADEATS